MEPLLSQVTSFPEADGYCIPGKFIEGLTPEADSLSCFIISSAFRTHGIAAAALDVPIDPDLAGFDMGAKVLQMAALIRIKWQRNLP